MTRNRQVKSHMRVYLLLRTYDKISSELEKI
jgi:hypothetical protein